MCQTKIHGGQEKMEDTYIRVSAGANACMRAHSFAVMRRRMGSHTHRNGLRANALGHAQTGMGRVQTRTYRAQTGMYRTQTGTGRAQTHAGRVEMAPKSQKTLEGYISLKTCPNWAFEVFFGIYGKYRCHKHLKCPIWIRFE